MSRAPRAGFTVAALALSASLAALGIWQLERREWKHALMAAVEQRTGADPVAAPGPGEWAALRADKDAYRRVRATGTFRHDRETLVQAVTDRGAGYWVLTPLETPSFTLLINRGFVPPDRRDPATRAAANRTLRVTVDGQMRMSEPGGAFLRSNRPATGRWYSRDVAAIARAQRLRNVAPYFVDADAAPNPGGYPVGGLTVIRFSDHHMIYALTWFALSLLAAFFAWRLWRPEGSRFNMSSE